MSALAPTLQAFFTERLIGQRQASPHTIAAYRDTFRMLLVFVQRSTGIAPHALDIDDLDATLIAAFLDHLEHDRRNSPRTRNHRLAEIRSLYHYAALRLPEHAATIARVLAIPAKRHDRGIVNYLTEPETNALLAAPDRRRWMGRRDHTLMTLAIQTGLRVSEITALRCRDVNLTSARTSRRSARAARNASPRSPSRPPTPCAPGCASVPATPTTRCSPPAAGARSAATPSLCWSPSTPPRRAPPARAWLARP